MYVTVRERDTLARRIAGGLAQHLVFAVHHRAADAVDDLTRHLTRQELIALAVVLADQCPPPRERPDDGNVDPVAVERAANGERLPLTPAEQAAVIDRMAAAGTSTRAIAQTLHLGWDTVHGHLTRKEPPTT